ncbi:MAG: peptidase M48 [Desulfuromonadales bacterium]|nr:MAG: peptidase M48 [Desulfuromonadales bacterium]
MRWGLLGLLLMLAGCAINPVTGRNELRLVPESTELSLGAEQYAPSRQSQGGDYSAHPQVAVYVRSVGQRLAAVSDRGLPYEFTVINDSTPNAWALPGGKIAVNRGLLTELGSEAELAAVLGHEIVHAAARHGAQGMERGILLEGAVLATSLATGGSQYADLASAGAALAAGLIGQKYGRDAERESDYYGMKYMARAGYDPQAAVSLQETFVRLADGKESNWLAGLFASHPPSRERVEANRQTAQTLAPGGEIGVERYRQQLAPLFAAKPAYAAYDQGLQALTKGDTGKALTLADQAIALEPREALFYGLRGDALQKEGKYRDAVTEYDRALVHNGDYFLFYQQRGLALQKLGERDRAAADLEQGMKRLPTATALNALGEDALAGGNRAKAKEYFAAAADTESPAGKAAARSLLRLDLPENPQKYLKIALGLDDRGYLQAQLSNPTGEAISDIGFTIRFLDGRGKQQTVRRSWSGPLAPGRSVVVTVGIGPLPNLKGAQAGIIAARLVERR